MTQTLLTRFGIPYVFSHLVAEAMMDLPPIKGDDVEFLRVFLGEVNGAFWTSYLSELPVETQADFRAAMESGEGDRILSWYEQYANFDRDPAAQERAERILRNLQKRLPEVARLAYTQYIQTISSDA